MSTCRSLPIIVAGAVAVSVSWWGLGALYRFIRRRSVDYAFLSELSLTESNICSLCNLIEAGAASEEESHSSRTSLGKVQRINMSPEIKLRLNKLTSELSILTNLVNKMLNETVVVSPQYGSSGKHRRNERKVTGVNLDKIAYESASEDEYYTAYEDDDIDAEVWLSLNDGFHGEKHKAMWRTLKIVNRKQKYYIECANYFAQNTIQMRKLRTKELQCVNDVDFLIKLHAIRNAFLLAFQNQVIVDTLINSVKKVFIQLFQLAKQDHILFEGAFNEIVDFCKISDNWTIVQNDLQSRNLSSFTFYDIIIDFCILDSLEDLDSPPSAIKHVLTSRALPYSLKEKALHKAILYAINEKRKQLKPENGFLLRFLNLSEFISHIFSCGLLCTKGPLHIACDTFVTEFKRYVTDIFSALITDYHSLEELSINVIKEAQRRIKHVDEQIQRLLSN